MGKKVGAIEDGKPLVLVIPLFNEADAVFKNLSEILRTADAQSAAIGRLLAVDDGSTDDTCAEVLRLAETDARVELLALTRNFGKESAIHAGLQNAGGAAVIVMDSDLQHPPELIGEMVARWRDGYAVVECNKLNATSEGLFRRFATSGFYRLLRWLSGIDLQGKTDFKLLDSEVVQAYCELPERRRFFRGLVHWLGYRAYEIPFEVPPRRKGESRWELRNLWRLAFTVLTGFSSSFLHLVNLAACFSLFLAALFGGKALWDKLQGVAVSGFTTVILLILIIGGIIMLSLGQIGLYIEHLFEEVKRRPTYVIDKRRSQLTAVTQRAQLEDEVRRA